VVSVAFFYVPAAKGLLGAPGVRRWEQVRCRGKCGAEAAEGSPRIRGTNCSGGDA